MQIGYAALFSWGVAYYQRGWDRDTVAQIEGIVARSAGVDPPTEGEQPRPYAIRERMLRDFGWPLVFAAALMLFSSVHLYRTLGSAAGVPESEGAVLALVTAFVMLVVAVGGVIARVARELSRPIVQVSEAAEVVASGQLEASVPHVRGPDEVARLSLNVERMRERLARTIGELEAERANLETKVEERTQELQKTLLELREAQAALVQGERLASIGELVAGVAHEINNPLNAVAGSAEPLEQVVADVRRVLDAYRAAERDLPPDRRRELEKLRGELDLDASLDDLVGISTVVRRATDRTVRIVQNLRNFARSTQEAIPTDIHANLEETLVLLAPRLRQSCIQVVKSYGELPLVTCRAGELNQVFMNLVMNAIQALEGTTDDEQAETDPTKEIRLETTADRGFAQIAITDNGPGVPGDLKNKIFDPFFTTKPRGQGTGLGLSISTDIVRKHGGTLHVERPREGGARFVVRIPVKPEPRQSLRAV
jgi:signal transduction histidine kinase